MWRLRRCFTASDANNVGAAHPGLIATVGLDPALRRAHGGPERLRSSCKQLSGAGLSCFSGSRGSGRISNEPDQRRSQAAPRAASPLYLPSRPHPS